MYIFTVQFAHFSFKVNFHSAPTKCFKLFKKLFKVKAIYIIRVLRRAQKSFSGNKMVGDEAGSFSALSWGRCGVQSFCGHLADADRVSVYLALTNQIKSAACAT